MGSSGLLVAALKLLARRGAQAGQAGTICLAIEEPELYQHPTQARAFASVLRTLAEDTASGMQVAYATHSPYFIEPRYFDQVRRVTRRPVPGGYPRVRVTHASIESVCKRLEGYEPELSVKSRWDQICLRHLPEAFFADGVILVEGDGDKAILEGATGTLNSLAVAGVAVAAASGKTKMLIPHAILAELDINTLLIFDNDSGCRARMERQQKDEVDIGLAELTIRDQNIKILRYFDLPEQDYPVGVLSTRVVAIDDTIEAMLTRDWPAWENTRSELVRQGRGVDGKNAATYWLAAHECPLTPSGHFAELLGAVLAL
jgi:putative ATP-dependent endonuclease of the OLD family